MPRAISCAEFKTRLDQAMDLMDRELGEIASHELDPAGAEFTFEDWWTYLADLIIPDMIMADAEPGASARPPPCAEPEAERRPQAMGALEAFNANALALDADGADDLGSTRRKG